MDFKKKLLIKYSLEFIVIVVGISVTFWIDEWNRNRLERIQHIKDIESIIDDLENDSLIIKRVNTSLDTGKTKLKFDVIDETLARTNLKLLKKNSLVNLERSITASTEIGGHLMSGHIHFTGKVKEIISKENTKDFIIGFPKKFKQYILEKGYIGVNGCSLTIGKVKNNSFNLHLIPETLSITNLKDMVKGDHVNIEIDQNTIAIVETVKNYLTAQKSR